MHALVSCPAVPEESDWDEAGEEYASWEAHFGFEDAVVGFGHLDDGCVGEFCDDGNSKKEPDAEADVCKAADIGMPVIFGDEDGGYGCEEEVEETIYHSHIEGEDEDDRREEEHL